VVVVWDKVVFMVCGIVEFFGVCVVLVVNLLFVLLLLKWIVLWLFVVKVCEIWVVMIVFVFMFWFLL